MPKIQRRRSDRSSSGWSVSGLTRTFLYTTYCTSVILLQTQPCQPGHKSTVTSQARETFSARSKLMKFLEKLPLLGEALQAVIDVLVKAMGVTSWPLIVPGKVVLLAGYDLFKPFSSYSRLSSSANGNRLQISFPLQSVLARVFPPPCPTRALFR